jgi:hypothetical protein
VEITDLPAEVHAILTRRAAAAHHSLREYVLALLVEDATRPTVAEVLARAARRRGSTATTDAIVAGIRADRDGR